MESAAVGIAVAGLDARVVETNPMLREMLGYTERELAGMSIAEFTHPDDLEPNLELLDELVAGVRERYQLEKRYVRKDGSTFWGRVNTSLVRDERGRPELVVATIEDVDARRQAEARLAEAESRYRTLVEQLPLVTYIDAIDDVSSNIYTSPQLEPVLGYSVEEWRSERELFVKLLHPDDRERVLREIAEATAAGGPFTSEYRLRARDGSVVWFRDESVPIADEHGVAIYDQGYLLDITDRKEAEEALARRDAVLEAVAGLAEQLLRVASWQTVDLAELGAATAVSRVYVFERRTDLPDSLVMSQRCEWAADGVPALIDDPTLASFDLIDFGLRDWIEPLASGRVVHANVRELQEPARSELERQSIHSLLLVPIVVGGDWWGVVGFDDCRSERVWTEGEIEALRAAAGILGETIGRERTARSLNETAQALRESEARFAAFMNNSQALAWMKDERGRYVYVNERWEHVTGRSGAESVGQTDFELFPDQAESYRAGDERVRRTGEPVEHLDVLVVPNGETRTFLALKFPFEDPAGRRYVGGVAFDVTEREQAEAALAETSRALRAIVDSSPLAIVTFDRDGIVTSWNEAAEQTFGWTAEEVVGRPNPMLRPEDTEQFRRLIESSLRGTSSRNAEAVRVRKDGTLVDVSVSSAPLHDASGRAIGMMAMLGDVSEQKQAAAALGESEERYRTLVANVPGAIYRCAPDESWTMSFMSEAIMEIAGYPSDDFIGNAVRSYGSIIHVDDRASVQQDVAAALDRGEPFSLEYRVVHADGGTRWVAEDGRPVYGSDGSLLWLDGVISDVTVQRQALDDRARTQALLDSVVEHIPTALFVKDAAELRFVRLNRAAEELFGYRREEFLGKSDVDFFPAEQASFFVAKDREVLAGGTLADIPEEPIEVRGGGTRLLHTRKVPILGENGKPIYLLGISEDITDRKHAEEEREQLVSALAAQNEQLLELDRMKDEFVALVSHELRTPLTSILGYLELILEGEVGGLTDQQRQFLSIVERNSNRLLKLVGDLLFVAQIEAGKLALEREDVDLAAIADDCVEAARPRAAEKEIRLELSGDEPAGLEGDRVRLAQLLDNLVSNAIKFTEQGGRVEVRVERRNGACVVTVADTGIGLGADELAHLFERFYRSTGASERAIQGTGLGLTITKAIAEAHGGSIAVESEQGVGTTFVVELPACSS